MTELVTILEEPKAETYLRLLQFARRQNSLFSLVWRDQHGPAPSTIAIEEALRPDLVREKRTDQWPGTRLLGHLATVRLYHLSSPALSVLAEAKRLFAWVAPDRPEDLAFYSEEDKPWLGSISHEKDSFLYSKAIDLEELCAYVRGLKVEPNQGYATEAVTAVLDALLGQSRARSVVAITDARNAAAVALLQRVGFGYESTAEAMFRGQACHEHTFVLTDEMASRPPLRQNPLAQSNSPE